MKLKKFYDCKLTQRAISHHEKKTDVQKSN